jgi:hypothetical protein
MEKDVEKQICEIVLKINGKLSGLSGEVLPVGPSLDTICSYLGWLDEIVLRLPEPHRRRVKRLRRDLTQRLKEAQKEVVFLVAEDELKKLVQEHGSVLVLTRNFPLLYSLEGGELRQESLMLTSNTYWFVKRFFPKIHPRANVFKVGEEEKEVLPAIQKIYYKLEADLSSLEFLQCEFAWFYDSVLLLLLKRCMEEGMDPKTAAVALALHDDDFGETYTDALEKADAAKKILEYAKEREALPTKEKKKEDIHQRLAERHGKIIELRKGSPSYHIHDGHGWAHVYMENGTEKFIEEMLEPVNTHMNGKHRVFAPKEGEMKAIEAMNDNSSIGYTYEEKGFPGLAEEYSTLTGMLRNPLSEPGHLDFLSYKGDMLQMLAAEATRTGKPLKEAADSLRERVAAFAKLWDDMMRDLREEERKWEPLLPYLKEYLPGGSKCAKGKPS